MHQFQQTAFFPQDLLRANVLNDAREKLFSTPSPTLGVSALSQVPKQGPSAVTCSRNQPSNTFLALASLKQQLEHMPLFPDSRSDKSSRFLQPRLPEISTESRSLDNLYAITDDPKLKNLLKRSHILKRLLADAA